MVPVPPTPVAIIINADILLLQRRKRTVGYRVCLFTIANVCQETQGSIQVHLDWREPVVCLGIMVAYCVAREIVILFHFGLFEGSFLNLIFYEFSNGNYEGGSVNRTCGQFGYNTTCGSAKRFCTALSTAV